MSWRALGVLVGATVIVACVRTVDAHATDCATAACVPGGGGTGSDCVFEWLMTPVPALDGNGLPGRKAICYEGDPLCDADADIGNASCTFSLTPCINNDDGRLPACIPSDVVGFEVGRPSPDHPRDAADAANIAVLEGEANQGLGLTVLRGGAPFLSGMPNAMLNACGATLPIDVPLRQRRSGVIRGRKTLRVEAITADGRRDSDTLKLECRPSTCGNGSVEAHEDCDDGNRFNGDGCNQGCRVEPATPTPTATGTPANSASATWTVTATGTGTATRTATWTVTATATATATATRTAMPTSTPTSTAPPPTASSSPTPTPTSTGTATATATSTATSTETFTRTATATETPTQTPTPTSTPPSMQLGITAFRPQSDGYGSPFQRRAVPVSEHVTPGVGVRINTDDDNNNGVSDLFDSPIASDNDLVELTLQANPIAAPAGYEYVLTRANGDLRVWDDAGKNAALLDANDELVLTFGAATRTVWVERLTAGETLLELIARPAGGGATIVTSPVKLFALTSVIIALGGENQVPSDPPDSNDGMFNIASTLYGLGYDVHMYDEDVVNSSGAGAAYNEVVNAVLRRGIGIVSIFGYSHGGGSTHDLADRLDANRASIGTFAMPYTAYVDGIKNSSDIDVRSEDRLPPSTAYHVNYYQRNDLFLRGNSVGGADVDVNVGSTPWGGGLVHGSVDDHANVRNGVLQPLLLRVPR